jgi:tRNA pseudouridine32 synthase / 23S rRNA pseudouridine746 synthase
VNDSAVIYWYEGRCPQSGDWLRLPRTELAEAIARQLMQQLAEDEVHSSEGKMYGILLVKTPTGEQQVLKAFSGLLNGQAVMAGWIPPIPGRDRVALEEARTLESLDAIKQELITLSQIPERQKYQQVSNEFESRLQTLALQHQQRKRERQRDRQHLSVTLSGEALEIALETLDEQSRQDGIDRRNLKREQDIVLQPIQSIIEQADQRIRELKQQRKEQSRQLQTQMHAAYCLTNFSGDSASLQELMAIDTIPTGTGDCCAPKLLHYAATHNLKPLAMAEFWWGAASANGDKIQGEFYGACAERCQPLMGFLLSGLPQRETIEVRNPRSLPILYEDDWLVVVDKPSGLLSVPGRYRHTQDSVLTRLRHLLPKGNALKAVHRLDQDTSGVLLLARDEQTHRQLSQQFQQRRVHKVYEAILAGSIAQKCAQKCGVIDLPLWSDPGDRPLQKVDWQRGKPSLTQFRVISTAADSTHLEFVPITGRTHQLRVHAADPHGLGIPILGDRLYGSPTQTPRLHLHAKELHFQHPQSQQTLSIKTLESPFPTQNSKLKTQN